MWNCNNTVVKKSAESIMRKKFKFGSYLFLLFCLYTFLDVVEVVFKLSLSVMGFFHDSKDLIKRLITILSRRVATNENFLEADTLIELNQLLDVSLHIGFVLELFLTCNSDSCVVRYADYPGDRLSRHEVMIVREELWIHLQLLGRIKFKVSDVLIDSDLGGLSLAH